MHLLNTTTAELRHFPSSQTVKYAIVSHVWQTSPKEQTFHEVCDIPRLCQERRDACENPDPLDFLSEKIRACCRVAKRAKYEWIWIDTCCIDNNSSAELSEAINSMFVWYADAQVCYAYLHDVGDEEDPSDPRSAFRLSIWHTRGWTLQELLAPACVIFLSRTWRVLGSKYSLALALVEVTGIRHDILTRAQSNWLEKASVAERMSWAAKRNTTRVEDRAYSLMGIFGINMPTIYGEGPRAFIRLQEEILRRIPDQSIFAWGAVHPDYSIATQSWTRYDEEDETVPMTEEHPGPLEVEPLLEDLLASSPSDFANCAKTKVLSIPDFENKVGLRGKVPQYTFTSYGMLVQLYLSTKAIDGGKAWAARTRQEPISRPIYAAILACSDQDKRPIVLILRPSQYGASPQYAVGEFVDGNYYRCALNPDMVINRKNPYAERGRVSNEGLWELEEIFIRHDYSTLTLGQARFPHLEQGATPVFTFHIPYWRLNALVKRHHLVLRTPFDDGMTLRVPYETTDGRLEHATASLQLVHVPLKEIVIVRIGLGCACTYVQESSIDNFWVDVRTARVAAPGHAQLVGGVLPLVVRSESEDSGFANLECGKAHLRTTKAEDAVLMLQFGDEERRVDVRIQYGEGFDPAGATLRTSYVLAVDLSGTMYEEAAERGTEVVDGEIPAELSYARAVDAVMGLRPSEPTETGPSSAGAGLGRFGAWVMQGLRDSLSPVVPVTAGVEHGSTGVAAN